MAWLLLWGCLPAGGQWLVVGCEFESLDSDALASPALSFPAIGSHPLPVSPSCHGWLLRPGPRSVGGSAVGFSEAPPLPLFSSLIDRCFPTHTQGPLGNTSLPTPARPLKPVLPQRKAEQAQKKEKPSVVAQAAADGDATPEPAKEPAKK